MGGAGYGQGRKKKKSKDVKKAYGEAARAASKRVDKPYEPWELRLGLAPAARSGDVVVRLEGALVVAASFSPRPARPRGPLGRAGRRRRPERERQDDAARRAARSRCRSRRARAGPARASCSASSSSGARRSPAASRCSTRSSRERALARGGARTLLAKFDLGADDVLRAAASLSPGERTRAVLALLSARGVNCLVLDEPTNHLDVEAIEELERALAGYDGTVLLVTHDRLFLERFGATRTIAL